MKEDKPFSGKIGSFYALLPHGAAFWKGCQERFTREKTRLETDC